MKVLRVEVERNRKDPTTCTQQPAFAEVLRLMFSKKHARRRDKQEDTEEVKHEVKTFHQRDAAPDHRAAHNQGSENSPNQNTALCERRNAKVRENQDKNKNVIHAQRILDEIAGKKIEAVVRPFDAPNKTIKRQGHENPDHGPLKRSADA